MQTCLGLKSLSWLTCKTIFEIINYVCITLIKDSLEAPFTEEELRKAIFDSNASRAPDPDGFTFFFYQHFF
jgi:Reverse transcriptase (RNA-dependent DNA polymerase)